MADIINRRLARIRGALNRNPPSNSDHLSTIWQELLEDFPKYTRGAPDAVEKWLVISSSDAVPGSIELLMVAIERDITVSDNFRAKWQVTSAMF